MRFPVSKSAIFAFAVFAPAFLPFSTFAEDAVSASTLSGSSPIVLKYVLKTADSYDLFIENRPNDASDLRIYDGSALIPPSTLEYLPNGAVRVRKYGKSLGEFSVERLAVIRDSEGASSKQSESKSSLVRFFDPQKAFLQSSVRREVLRDVPVYTIPIEFGTVDPVFSGTTVTSDQTVRPKYSVSINSDADVPLEIDPTGAYQPNRAYVSYGKLVFHEASFPNAVNTVLLKVDGVPSNFVTIQKNADLIGNSVGLEYEAGVTNPAIILKTENVRNIRDLSSYEFRINGILVNPESLASTGSNSVSTGFWYSGPLIFKIFPSSLATGEHSVKIEVKEKSSLLSDSEIFDFKDVLVPRIQAVETTKNGPVAKISVQMNPFSLLGDYEKIKIVVNGTGYTSQGAKVALLNADGTVKKDINGYESYEFRDRLDFTKTTTGLRFEFPLSALKETDNTLLIENGNSAKSSESVRFDLASSAIRTTSVESGMKDESVTFAPAEKTLFEYDPVGGSGSTASLGTFQLGDLKNGIRYRFSAKFALKSPKNPFARLAFQNSARSAVVASEGDETTFALLEEGLGGTLPLSYETVVQLNPAWATEGGEGFELREFRLESLESSGFEIVFQGAPLKGSVSHFSEFPGCFDSLADFCGKNGLPKDSSAKFSFAFWKAALPSISGTSSGSGTSAGTATVKKRNDPYRLVLPSQAGPVAKLIHSKFSATMEKMKTKLRSDPKAKEKLSKLKKAFEKALASARNYEKETKAKVKAFHKKMLLSDLKSAIKSAADASK